MNNSSSLPPSDAVESNVVANESDSFEAWMRAFGIIAAIFSLLMCCVGIFFMVSIFRLRKFTFNLYIIFAILPDSLCNGILGVSLFYEALHGFMPLFLCEWKAFHLIFYYFSNLYVNAVIAKEVMALVQNSYHRRRMKPPTTKKVVVQVGLIYGMLGLATGWLVAPLPWSIMTVRNDPICVTPFKNNVGGILTGTVISMPPFLYTFWVAYKIWKDQLLPLQGRTRVLALYFLRIIVIFVAFYVPILVLANYVIVMSPDVGEPVPTSYFIIMKTLELLYPIQNVVTFRFMLQKDDINMAVQQNIDRMLCRSPDDKSDEEYGTEDTSDNAQHTSEWQMDDIYEIDKTCHRRLFDRSMDFSTEIDIPEGGNDTESINTRNKIRKISFVTAAGIVVDHDSFNGIDSFGCSGNESFQEKSFHDESSRPQTIQEDIIAEEKETKAPKPKTTKRWKAAPKPKKKDGSVSFFDLPISQKYQSDKPDF